MLRILISCHLPKSCSFLSSLCHSFSILCRAACPFSVGFHYLADGCYCLLSHFPCPVLFSLSPAFLFFIAGTGMLSPLFQISALSSSFLLCRVSMCSSSVPYFLESVSPSFALSHLHPLLPDASDDAALYHFLPSSPQTLSLQGFLLVVQQGQE